MISLFPFIKGFPSDFAKLLARTSFRPEPSLPYEPMFVYIEKMTARAADAADLLIEFATLGEYGLEYVEGKGSLDRALLSRTLACEGRSPTRSERASGANRETRRGRERRPTGSEAGPSRRSHRKGRNSGEPGSREAIPTSKLPEALQPPRIELSWQTAA